MNDWKKVFKKFLVVSVEVLILGVIGYVTEHPELVFLTPILEAARNAWKHR